MACLIGWPDFAVQCRGDQRQTHMLTDEMEFKCEGLALGGWFVSRICNRQCQADASRLEELRELLSGRSSAPIVEPALTFPGRFLAS